MKILIIGGTGTISAAVTRLLAEQGHEVSVINRGSRNSVLPEGVRSIVADMDDEDAVREKLSGMEFDAVGNFIAFNRNHVERDFRLFNGKTRQYIFISSASAYNKPARSYIINEGTTLANPHWIYSQNKIACEEYLMRQYRENGFPVTIVRPSHTYDERHVPLGVHGKNGFWQVLRRMLDGKQVIIQGDGTSLWTLTHNTDFAAGYAGLVGNPHAIGEAFQITSDETLTWNQIYQTIAGSLNVPLRACHVASDFLAAVGRDYDFEGSLVGDKSVSVVFDNSKLKRAVPGFCAKVRFDQGVRQSVSYIFSHPEECQKEDKDFDKWCDAVISAQEKAKEAVLSAVKAYTF